MVSRQRLGVAVVVMLVLAAGRVSGVSQWTTLEPGNLGKQEMATFTVEAKRVDDVVRYQVTVEAKKGRALSEILAGALSVMDGKKVVVQCEVQGGRTAAGVVYAFEVGAKYTEGSVFTFGNMAGTKEHPAPAGDFYTIALKDFPGK
jgi:hypothetical protein